MAKKMYVVLNISNSEPNVADRIWNAHKHHIHCIDNPDIYICTDDDDFAKWFHCELYRESEVY